jgi:acyl-coenzyme A synthetase/AMP-(fatty) acid ligase
VDEDGFIFITGRQKDFVKSGGRRVSCREVEEHLLAFDELLEAAVIGVPDEILGEAVKAFVVPRSREHAGLIERLNQFCKENMNPHLVPKEILILDGLPKNSAGKVLKEALKALAPSGNAH